MNSITDEHENCVAAVENVGVEMQVFLAEPDKQQFRNQQWVANDVKSDEAQKGLGEEPRPFPSNLLQVKDLGPKADN